MKFARLALSGLAVAAMLGAQPAGSASAAPPPARSWNTIRKGEAFVPLTPEERLRFLFRRTMASPGVPVRAMFQAALDQKGNYPEKWGQGWDAYGHRMLFHLARSGTRNLIESGAAAALGYEQRYIRCNCDGVMRRTGHALAMNFVTYNRAGHWAPNIPRVGSGIAVEYIALQWLPDGTRTAREVTRGIGLHLASGSLVNIWREFSPEVKKLLKRK